MTGPSVKICPVTSRPRDAECVEWGKRKLLEAVEQGSSMTVQEHWWREHSGGCLVNGAGNPRGSCQVASRGVSRSLEPLLPSAWWCLSLIPYSSGAGNQPPLLSVYSAPSRTYRPLRGPMQDGLLSVTNQGRDS